jgi:hypothetical protein
MKMLPLKLKLSPTNTKLQTPFLRRYEKNKNTTSKQQIIINYELRAD